MENRQSITSNNNHHNNHNNMICARLCHIIKWDDFDGYGFNLHAEKGKTGQYIGKVDDGSPSEAAGLQQGDRIIEVNDINIAGETHKQVVERIKSFPNETKLLVVDQKADDYFRSNNIPIRSGMTNIKILKTPDKKKLSQDMIMMESSKNGTATTTSTTTTTNNSNTSMTKIVNNDHNQIEESEKLQQMPMNSNNDTSNTSEEMMKTTSRSNSLNDNNLQNGNNSNSTPRVSDEKTPSTTTVSMDQTNGKSNSSSQQQEPLRLNLTMSAKELRAKLASRKKYDPKKEAIGFKDKFDIVQKL